MKKSSADLRVLSPAEVSEVAGGVPSASSGVPSAASIAVHATPTMDIDDICPVGAPIPFPKPRPFPYQATKVVAGLS